MNNNKIIKSVFLFVVMALFIGWNASPLSGSVLRPVKSVSYNSYIYDPDGIYAQIPLGLLDSVCLKLWWNEDLSCYDLFLPSFVGDGDEISIFTMDDRGATLDDAELPIAITLEELSEKDHIVTKKGDTAGIPVITHKSANISSSFVEIKREYANQLCTPPYKEYPEGRLRIISERGSLLHDEDMDNIRVRGNTSADWIKKPFQVTLKYPQKILGMGAARRWNFLSNRSDHTFIRNKLALDMAFAADLPYTPSSAFTDLYINGEYYGNYQICEKVEVENDRVDIRNLSDSTNPIFNENDQYLLKDASEDELAAAFRDGAYRVDTLESGINIRSWDTIITTDDISGGYLLEIERPSRIWESPGYFTTKRGQSVTIRSPKYPGEEEAEYIAGYWQAFEDSLFSEDGIHPETGLHYSQYTDMDSLVKKYLVEEITRNYDASSTSQYFYKDAADVLRAGPVWDYDMSLGNPVMNPRTNQKYISSVSPYGLYAGLYMDDYSIWAVLSSHADFRERCREMYAEVFLPILKSMEDNGVSDLHKTLEMSALMDLYRYDPGGDALEEYRMQCGILDDFLTEREGFLTGLWLEGRESVRVYLNAGEADIYVSYVENLKGEPLSPPPDPEWEGYNFLYWTNGYEDSGEPYDFQKPYDGSPMYLAAVFETENGERIITYIE